MKFKKLEDEQRKFFDQNGYLTIPNALDSDMLDQVTAACDRVVEQQYKEMGKRRASLINVLPEDDVFLRLVAWETTVPLIVQLLSFHIRLSKSHIIYKYPDPPGIEHSDNSAANWHRDFRESPFDLGPHRYPRLMIKVVYQLSDTGPESGNTVILPQSNNFTTGLEIPEGQTDPEGARELELRAGDAYFFESRVFHKVGLNRTTFTRKCLMMGYSYAWITPLDYDLQPESLTQKVTDPITRQLIGANKMSSTEIDPTALREWADKHGVQRSSEIESARLMSKEISN